MAFVAKTVLPDTSVAFTVRRLPELVALIPFPATPVTTPVVVTVKSDELVSMPKPVLVVTFREVNVFTVSVAFNVALEAPEHR